MSDEQKGVSFQGETSPAAEQVEGSAPQYFTRQEAQRLRDDIMEDVKRQTQSLTDKASSRIEKKVQDELKKFDEVVALQKQAGIDLDPVGLKAARQDIIASVLSKVDDDLPPVAQPKAEQKSPDPQEAVVAFTNQAAEAIFEELGVVVEPEDPEAKDISHDSPKEFLKSLRKAAEAKKQRIETPGEVRVPGTQSGSVSNQSLENQYKAEMLENRGKGTRVGAAIKEKYREKGVNVDGISLFN